MNKIKYIIVMLLCVFLTGCSDDEIILETASDTVDEIQSEIQYEGSDEDNSIYVYICGEIERPGVYELPGDSRMYELVNRAGGLLDTADISYINQAEPLKDAQKVYVPSKAESKALAEGSSPESSLININTADINELTKISGIGASRAADIVSYREANGPFATIEDIMKVSGIKEGLFAKIKDQITV